MGSTSWCYAGPLPILDNLGNEIEVAYPGGVVEVNAAIRKPARPTCYGC
jgi:hypothetical protein